MKTPYVNPYQTLEFFRDSLRSEQGELARRYLASRKIDHETAELFKLGYCPIAFLGYGTWKRRVILPLIDPYDKVIGFSGRLITYRYVDDKGTNWLLEQETNRPLQANYANGQKWDSGDRILYHDAIHKSVYLFGFHETKKYIREAGYAIVVEGQFDFLSMYQAGFRNVVGMLGSTLTEHNITMLSRYCDRVLFMFDADDAGFSAMTKSGIKSTISHDWIRLPTGMDPHEVITTYGPDPVRQLLDQILANNSKPVIEKQKEDLDDIVANITRNSNDYDGIIRKVF